jgi:hypothetical protein
VTDASDRIVDAIGNLPSCDACRPKKSPRSPPSPFQPNRQTDRPPVAVQCAVAFSISTVLTDLKIVSPLVPPLATSMSTTMNLRAAETA